MALVLRAIEGMRGREELTRRTEVEHVDLTTVDRIRGKFIGSGVGDSGIWETAPVRLASLEIMIEAPGNAEFCHDSSSTGTTTTTEIITQGVLLRQSNRGWPASTVPEFVHCCTGLALVGGVVTVNPNEVVKTWFALESAIGHPP